MWEPGHGEDRSAAFHMEVLYPGSDIHSFGKLCYKRSCIFLALVFTGGC